MEDKHNSDLFSACAIHKINSDTFVLTHEDIDKVSDLVVHFSNNSTKPTKSIAFRPLFVVLAVREEHKTCNSVLWTDPIIDSEALILVSNIGIVAHLDVGFAHVNQRCNVYCVIMYHVYMNKQYV